VVEFKAGAPLSVVYSSISVSTMRNRAGKKKVRISGHGK